MRHLNGHDTPPQQSGIASNCIRLDLSRRLLVKSTHGNDLCSFPQLPPPFPLHLHPTLLHHAHNNRRPDPLQSNRNISVTLVIQYLDLPLLPPLLHHPPISKQQQRLPPYNISIYNLSWAPKPTLFHPAAKWHPPRPLPPPRPSTHPLAPTPRDQSSRSRHHAVSELRGGDSGGGGEAR